MPNIVPLESIETGAETEQKPKDEPRIVEIQYKKIPAHKKVPVRANIFKNSLASTSPPGHARNPIEEAHLLAIEKYPTSTIETTRGVLRTLEILATTRPDFADLGPDLFSSTHKFLSGLEEDTQVWADAQEVLRVHERSHIERHELLIRTKTRAGFRTLTASELNKQWTDSPTKHTRERIVNIIRPEESDYNTLLRGWVNLRTFYVLDEALAIIDAANTKNEVANAMTVLTLVDNIGDELIENYAKLETIYAEIKNKTMLASDHKIASAIVLSGKTELIQDIQRGSVTYEEFEESIFAGVRRLLMDFSGFKEISANGAFRNKVNTALLEALENFGAL